MITLNDNTINSIKNEMESIPEKYHKPFNSFHEGYAILLEEVRELENEIFFGEKKLREQITTNLIIDEGLDQSQIDSEVSRAHKQRIKEECVQIAAMSARIIQELT